MLRLYVGPSHSVVTIQLLVTFVRNFSLFFRALKTLHFWIPRSLPFLSSLTTKKTLHKMFKTHKNDLPFTIFEDIIFFVLHAFCSGLIHCESNCSYTYAIGLHAHNTVPSRNYKIYCWYVFESSTDTKINLISWPLFCFSWVLSLPQTDSYLKKPTFALIFPPVKQQKLFLKHVVLWKSMLRIV
jgi:hypothetical protein